MKLTAKERQAISLIRKLDTRQREKLLGDIRRQILANGITARVGGLRRLKIVDDKAIEKAFGSLPAPSRAQKRSMPRRRGDPDKET